MKIDGFLYNHFFSHPCFRYPEILVEVMGSDEGACVLYFLILESLEKNEFAVGDDTIKHHALISDHVMRKIKKKLKNFPFLNIQLKGRQAITHYKLDKQAFIVYLQKEFYNGRNNKTSG